MKLNPDCVRDLLIEIEENTNAETSISFDCESVSGGPLARYSAEELKYHILQCDLCGYLVNFRDYCSGKYEVDFLSPIGHAFLADVRSDTVWKHTKGIAGKIGVWSLDALKSIATGVVSEMIRLQLSNPANRFF